VRTAQNRAPTENPEQFVCSIWSPEIIIWDDANYSGGHLYETNTAALAAAISALDNICYVALVLSADKAHQPF
jgi:hypothetical protein